MKKLMTTLATIALVAGSLTSITAFTKTPQLKNIQAKPKISTNAINPYAIASKLRKHTIKLDPNTWLNRNIKDYTSQLNAIIVKDGILTAAEASHVTWSSVDLNVAGWYWTVNFTVTGSPGISVTDNACLDMDSGETTAQIKAKLMKKPIQLNYNYWNSKLLHLENYLSELKSIIVNEGILTKIEASEIVGIFAYDTTGVINWNINDNNTESSTPGFKGYKVVKDGDSAQQLANKIVSSDVFRLKTDALGKYADSNVGGVLDNIHQQLIYYNIYTQAQLQYIKTPHVKLQDDNKNFVFSAEKDGQIFQAPPCEVLAHTYANMTRDMNSDGNFEVSANLTPHIVNMLWNYYHTGPSANFFLGYFYQMLNNGGFQQWWDIPSGAGLPQSFKSGDTLGALMSDFWQLNFDSATDAISYYCDTSNSSVASFYNDLSSAVDQAYATGNGMGVSFWLQTGHGVGPNIPKYSFW